MSDFVQRLGRERDELEAKTDKLCRFIASRGHQELNATQREMTVAQYHAMNSYLTILRFRIADLLNEGLEK